jgi:Tfp pilus assembly protein PilF
MEVDNMSDMRRILILMPVLVFIIVGCGGVGKINTGIDLPELDRTQYNDSAYTKGWENLKAGNPKQAIKNFEMSNSADEKLYVGFGYAFLQRNKMSLARRNFEKALELNPDNIQAQFGMAILHELLNEKMTAFRIYSNLRIKYPESTMVKVRYDYIKSTETRNYLEKAHQYKNEHKTGKYIDALKQASAYSPEIINIEIEIADFYNLEGQYEQAAQHYENVLEKFPDKEGILVKLAAIYEESREFDSAVVIYKRLLKLKPGDITYINKINDLKIQFYELNMPEKFKNIFFKPDINREELAALIGHYFNELLDTMPTIIITDIGGSFAKEHIIKVCTLGIMKVRPDHSFDRFSTINRASFAVVINGLLKYLRDKEGYSFKFTPSDEIFDPRDISSLHKNYETIKFLVNSQVIKLDEENKFNPTVKVAPSDVLISIRRILNSIEKR